MAFTVDDATKIYHKAVERGGIGVHEPHTLTDEHGSVTLSSVKTYGDTIHTFVQRDGYNGVFLPGYIEHPDKEILNTLLDIPDLR